VTGQFIAKELNKSLATIFPAPAPLLAFVVTPIKF